MSLLQSDEWIRSQIDIHGAELEQMIGSRRYGVVRSVFDWARAPWRLDALVRGAARAVRSRSTALSPLEARERAAHRGPLDYAASAPVVELRDELARVVSELEGVTASRAYAAAEALATLRSDPREAWRRWTEWGGYVLRTPGHRGRVEPRPEPSLPLCAIGPAWFEAVFARRSAGDDAAIVLVWIDPSTERAQRDAWRARVRAARGRGARIVLWADDESDLRNGASDWPRDRSFVVRGEAERTLAPVIDPQLHNPIGWWSSAGSVPPAWEHQAPASWQEAFRAGRGLSGTSKGERFVGAREAHETRTVAHLVETLGRDLGIEAPLATPLVTLGLCTNRPDRLAGVTEALLAQVHPRYELSVVLHGPGFDDGPLRERCQERGVPLSVTHAPVHHNLGQVRQTVHEQASGAWIAKIDDDDHYGPHYAGDMVWEAVATGAALVSKQNCLVQTTHDGRLYQRRSAPELCYWPGLGAGSQLVDTRVVLELGIRPVPRSEDTALLFDVVRQGLPVVAGDPYHYVYRRGPAGEHNWSLSPEAVAAVMGLVPVADGVTIADFEP